MSKDPMVDFEEISKIEYDAGAAKILATSSPELYRMNVHNKFDTEQTSEISGELSWSETKGWSDTVGVKVGVKTSFKCAVPFITEGGVEVSVEASNEYTWHHSDTHDKKVSFRAPVTLPPHGNGVVLAHCTLATIAVPYALTGTFVLKSGTKWCGELHGLYTGSNGYNIEITLAPANSPPAVLKSVLLTAIQ
jgi:hypothetical protein